MLIVVYFLFSVVIVANGYKIKRTECNIESESSTLFCTCGGTGDPFAIVMNKGPAPKMGVPFYSTRFGHNFGQQIKEAMLLNNRTVEDYSSKPVTKVVYHNCTDYPFRLKIDFAEFRTIDSRTKVDLSKIEDVYFENLHSVNIYFYNPFNWGHINFQFNNIQNKSEFNTPEVASVLIRGNLVTCKNPCIDVDREEGNDRNRACTLNCFNQTTIHINITNTPDVLLHDLTVKNERNVKNTELQVDNLENFRVEGGSYRNLVLNLYDVNTCYAWKNTTDCENVLELGSGGLLEEEGYAGVVIAATTVILLFVIILLAVIATRPKSNM